MNNAEAKLQYSKIISQCWDDPDFKKRFIKSPADVFKEFNIPVDTTVTYKVIEAPKLVEYIAIPFEGADVALQILSKLLLEKASTHKVVIEENAELRIIQNTKDIFYLIIPFSPKLLTSAELKKYGLKLGDVTASVTNVVGVAEVVAVVVEAHTVATTVEVAAEVGVAAVVVGVIVLI